MEKDGGAGSANALIDEKGAPCADKPPFHNEKEKGGDERTEYGDADESIRRDRSRFSAASKDTGTDKSMSGREVYNSADKHGESAHSESFRIGRVEGKYFFSENSGERESDSGADERPLDACPFKGVPFRFRFFADRLSCGDHACFSESDDVIPVNIGNIHTDTVDGEGNRPQARRHAGKENHTDTLEALFAENGKKYGRNFLKIGFIRNERTALQKVVFFHEKNSPAQTENRTYHCADRRAGNAHGRNRPHAENQYEIHDDIYDIRKDIRFHNDGGLSETELNRLEKECE